MNALTSQTHLVAANAAVLELAKEGQNILRNTEKLMLDCTQAQLALAAVKQEKTALLAEINEEASHILSALRLLTDESENN